MSEDEQRVQVQIALWQMLEAEGMKPTTDLVRRIRKLVEDGLKDRDVVLEEAASICAVMAEDFITGQSKLGEGMPRNAAIAGILQSAEANILALKERV